VQALEGCGVGHCFSAGSYILIIYSYDGNDGTELSFPAGIIHIIHHPHLERITFPSLDSNIMKKHTKMWFRRGDGIRMPLNGMKSPYGPHIR